MTEQTAVKITGVATTAVPVRDPDAALAFYTGTLGMELRRDAQFGPGLRWIEVAPAGATTTIALAPASGDFVPGRDTGIRVIAPDADGVHAGLREAGADVDEQVLRIPNVPPMFGFRDPEGNGIYLIEG